MNRPLQILLNRSQRRRLGWILLGLGVGAGLELLGIGAIPAFVRLLLEPGRLLARLPAGGWADTWRTMELAKLVLLGAAALVVLFVGKNLYAAGLQLATTRLVQDIRADIGERLFRAYLYRPYTFHLQRNPAQLASTIQVEVGRCIYLLESGLRLVREALVLLVVFALLVALDPWVCLGVFGLMASASAVFYLAVRRSLRRRGRRIQRLWARLGQVMNQSLGAIKEAKILGREPSLTAQFTMQVRDLSRHESYQQLAVALPRLFLEVMAVAAVLLVVAGFVLLGRPVQALLPVLALLAIASVRLVPSLAAINSALSSMRYNQAALDLVGRELETLEERPSAPAAQAAADRGPAPRTLSLHGVHYQYPGAAAGTLAGISLEVRAGEAVAFIGPSGAGKSTLVDVILGLLAPARGEVRVDSRSVHAALADWHRHLGYVPQEIYLLDDTIRRNVAFGVPDAEIDEAAVRRAVTAAQLDETVAGLPAGLDTVVGNRGVRISGGQRQRIGLARALYRDPAVLVLDEATSALDSETERAVIRAVTRDRGGRMLILVAHRLTTVQDCDRLYLLEGGRVMDEGTLPELLARHLRLSQGPAPARVAEAVT